MKKKNKNKHNNCKQNKVKISDKIAGALFEQIIDVLLDKYEKSTEKETMSFEEYCRSLKDLSYKTRKGEKTINGSGTD